MPNEKRSDYQRLLDKLITMLSGLPWLDLLEKAWKIIWKLIQGQPDPGMYEVLEYESTLELKDRGGKRATFKKREKVRYLQDNVIAYQDQAWGDGEILLNYRCSPGTPVDRYRSGYKTYILISRREVKNKGEVDEFNVEWRMRDGFLRDTEQWETHVKHNTKHLKINVIFPKSRPPQHTTLIEGNRQRGRVLGKDTQVPLPDGRWQVTWETHRPRLYENYILQWKW
jgi:hypothetical protein